MCDCASGVKPIWESIPLLVTCGALSQPANRESPPPTPSSRGRTWRCDCERTRPTPVRRDWGPRFWERQGGPLTTDELFWTNTWLRNSMIDRSLFVPDERLTTLSDRPHLDSRLRLVEKCRVGTRRNFNPMKLQLVRSIKCTPDQQLMLLTHFKHFLALRESNGTQESSTFYMKHIHTWNLRGNPQFRRSWTWFQLNTISPSPSFLFRTPVCQKQLQWIN